MRGMLTLKKQDKIEARLLSLKKETDPRLKSRYAFLVIRKLFILPSITKKYLGNSGGLKKLVIS